MASRLLPSISAAEFAMMMRKTVPNPMLGWNGTLAVANSGGPDSTCLLFLLHRYLTSPNSEKNLPQKLVSVTVDHDLQASSSAMAERAARIAESLNIEHVSVKLQWGQGHYLEKPGLFDKIEEKARVMRQLALFDQMKNLNANVAAMGHHADDQVETMLMRLFRGSSRDGLGGMRRCRRWGMGTTELYSKPFAIEGMRKWIIRPLLGVRKDRILSTCAEHNLDYVTDPTNFQPQLTARNAIRHAIQQGPSRSGESNMHCTILRNLTDMQIISPDTDGPSTLDSMVEKLHSISQDMALTRHTVDETVDKLLQKISIPSPPGTFMISPLALRGIGDESILAALLFRITRFISPEPWGHPRAELGRRKTSVLRLMNLLRDADPTTGQTSVCVGSGVWWRLVSLHSSKLSFKTKDKDTAQLAWIASRQPPKIFRNSSGETVSDPLLFECTNDIVRQYIAWKTRKESPLLEVLYDRRFLVGFDMDSMPTAVAESLSTSDAKIYIKNGRPWDIPRVFLEERGASTVLHSTVINDNSVYQRPLRRKELHNIDSKWITIQYYRELANV